jgi:hypothetical protein
MDSACATELRDTTYGLLAAASDAMKVSKATVSRDFALVGRIHRQFGRNFDPKTDKIFWSWDWSYYRVYDSRAHKGRIRGACRSAVRLTLASRKLKTPTAGSISCPGTTANSSHRWVRQS